MILDSAESWNLPVWDGQKRGHYEVWYLKFNLPEENVAFWLRYTLLSPITGMGEPVGELWAVAFDAADPLRNRGYKSTFPVGETALAYDRLFVRLGRAELRHTGCSGKFGDGGVKTGLSWELSFVPDGPPLSHFPHDFMYSGPFPKTKVRAPLLSMNVGGHVRWNGREFRFLAARGHQAHIWGVKHAERWAWGNCNDFDGDDAVFEALSARIRLGGAESPDMTIAALRLDGREYLFNQTLRWFLNRTRYDVESWEMSACRDGLRLDARFTNRPDRTAGVIYRDPDGEARICHNSKLADLTVDLYRRNWGFWKTIKHLECRGRAAFEVVQREADPRVKILI